MAERAWDISPTLPFGGELLLDTRIVRLFVYRLIRVAQQAKA
jgi:hypothetical protein